MLSNSDEIQNRPTIHNKSAINDIVTEYQWIWLNTTKAKLDYLLHGHRLRQIARLIDITLAHDGDVITQ